MLIFNGKTPLLATLILNVERNGKIFKTNKPAIGDTFSIISSDTQRWRIIDVEIKPEFNSIYVYVDSLS
jgi:hypothetical protein